MSVSYGTKAWKAREAMLAKKKKNEAEQHKANLATAVKLLAGILPKMGSYTGTQKSRHKIVRQALDVLAGELATKG